MLYRRIPRPAASRLAAWVWQPDSRGATPTHSAAQSRPAVRTPQHLTRTCAKLRGRACHQRQPREHHEATLPEHAACLWPAYFWQQHAMQRWRKKLGVSNHASAAGPPWGPSLCRTERTAPLSLRKTAPRGCNAAVLMCRILIFLPRVHLATLAEPSLSGRRARMPGKGRQMSHRKRGRGATAQAAGQQTAGDHNRAAGRLTCRAALSCPCLLLGHTRLGAPPADPPT